MVAHVNTVAVDTSSGAVDTSMLHPYLINHQLFSQAYLRDLQSTRTRGEYRESADACRQTIREWLSWLPSPSKAILGSDGDGSQDRANPCAAWALFSRHDGCASVFLPRSDAVRSPERCRL